MEREKRANISLKIDAEGDQDSITISGRGELHLSVLIETMLDADVAWGLPRLERWPRARPRPAIQSALGRKRSRLGHSRAP